MAGFHDSGIGAQENRLLLLGDQAAEDRVDFVGDSIHRLKKAALRRIFKARQAPAAM